MKIKLNESDLGDWRYINTPKVNLYEGKLITYRESKKFGYRFTLIALKNKYYVAQALYEPNECMESISVHEAYSINDAKAMIEVMIQFIKGMRQPVPEVPSNAA